MGQNSFEDASLSEIYTLLKQYLDGLYDGDVARLKRSSIQTRIFTRPTVRALLTSRAKPTSI